MEFNSGFKGLTILAVLVYKPEAANIVRAPGDERCDARNMLSLQKTLE